MEREPERQSKAEIKDEVSEHNQFFTTNDVMSNKGIHCSVLYVTAAASTTAKINENKCGND